MMTIPTGMRKRLSKLRNSSRRYTVQVQGSWPFVRVGRYAYNVRGINKVFINSSGAEPVFEGDMDRIRFYNDGWEEVGTLGDVPLSLGPFEVSQDAYKIITGQDLNG